MATHFSPWVEEPGRLQFTGPQRDGNDSVTKCACVCARARAHTHTHNLFAKPLHGRLFHSECGRQDGIR